MGSLGSGRRFISLDLISSTIEPHEKAILAISNNEKTLSSFPPKELPSNISIQHYNWKGKKPILGEESQKIDSLFWILDSTLSMIDQIENVANWFKKKDLKLTRSITILDCQLLFNKPILKEWAKACIHFSDVVLLNHYHHLPPPWIKNLCQDLKKESHPYILQKVSNNAVDNPYEVLYNEPRRMSLIFDDEDSIDALELNEEELLSIENPIDLKPRIDKYLERLDNGIRKISIPQP